MKTNLLKKIKIDTVNNIVVEALGEVEYDDLSANAKNEIALKSEIKDVVAGDNITVTTDATKHTISTPTRVSNTSNIGTANNIAVFNNAQDIKDSQTKISDLATKTDLNGKANASDIKAVYAGTNITVTTTTTSYTISCPTKSILDTIQNNVSLTGLKFERVNDTNLRLISDDKYILDTVINSLTASGLITKSYDAVNKTWTLTGNMPTLYSPNGTITITPYSNYINLETNQSGSSGGNDTITHQARIAKNFTVDIPAGGTIYVTSNNFDYLLNGNCEAYIQVFTPQGLGNDASSSLYEITADSGVEISTTDDPKIIYAINTKSQDKTIKFKFKITGSQGRRRVPYGLGWISHERALSANGTVDMDNELLLITGTSPYNLQVGANPIAPIKIYFNQNITKVAGASLTLQANGAASSSLGFTVSDNILTSDGIGLLNNTEYTVTLPASSVSSAINTYIKNSLYSFKFTTIGTYGIMFTVLLATPGTVDLGTINSPSVDFSINWGDGSQNTSTGSHTYTSGGEYNISISGTAAEVSTMSVDKAFIKTDSEAFINGLTPAKFIFGAYAVENASKIKTLNIIGTQELWNFICYTCQNLTTINGDTVTTIGQKAFYGCTGLTEINFPNVETIDQNAFYGCTGLTEINFPNVETIGQSAFSGCTGLTEINFPNVETIGQWAFSGCTGLTEITLPSLLSITGNKLFDNCSNLEFIDLPALQSTPTEDIFGSCAKLKILKIGTNGEISGIISGPGECGGTKSSPFNNLDTTQIDLYLAPFQYARADLVNKQWACMQLTYDRYTWKSINPY